MFYIQSLSTGGTLYWKEWHSSVTTNNFGLFNLVVGNGVRQTESTVATFNLIDWSVTPKYLKTEIYYAGSWKDMGTSQLMSVPYSITAGDLAGTVDKLSVKGTTSGLEEALFEVKNKDGQTVFAVYNEGVRVYVSDGAKALKGGFAVGGFGTDKAESTKYLFVGKDSVRIYLDTNPLTKAVKSGFAVGGYDLTKGTIQDYLDVNSDSVRIYIDSNPATKKVKGGFAVGGYDMTKGTNTNFMNVNTDASGIINPSQNRILWYPLKNAFLTGRVLVEDKDSVGTNSFASGYESKAKGQYSQALGYQSIARGQYSTSIGYQSVANKDNSFAFGQWAKAKNEESYAFGRGAIAEGFRSFAFGSAGVDSAGKITGVAYAKGNYSFAIGQGSQAIGTGSMALGLADTAKNDYSIAIGYLNSAEWGAVSLGWWTKAKGFYSTATGNSTVAKGNYSTAMGFRSSAMYDHSISIGNQTLATGFVSVAIGYQDTASGYSSVAMGMGTRADGICSFSGGQYSRAIGSCSEAFGLLNKANGNFSFAAGALSVAKGSSSFAMGDHATANGESSVAFGYSSKSDADYAASIGFNVLAGGKSSAAIGYYATAGADYSIALGYHANAGGASSIAIGHQASATNDRATAIGSGSTASGQFSTALGIQCTASGSSSTALGINTIASGSSATAMGSETMASESSSLAIGYQTNASGPYSTAMGKNTTASGWYSTSCGANTSALSAFETVFGRYNTSYTPWSTDNWYFYDRLFVIGNGTSSSSMSDALVVLKNGNIGIGTSFPQTQLHIKGNGNLLDLEGTAQVYIPWYPLGISNGVKALLGFYGAGTTDFLIANQFTTGSNNIILQPGTNGKIGIGSSTPTEVLDVNGNGRFRSIGSGAYVGAINRTSDGTLTTATSDIRTKNNISNLTNSLNAILNLRGISFTWKDEPEMGRRIGFIAQEVEPILPELVFTNPADGLKGVNYAEMTAVLVEAMKEQQHQIESYKSENDYLKSQLQTLQEKVDKIETLLAKAIDE